MVSQLVSQNLASQLTPFSLFIFHLYVLTLVWYFEITCINYIKSDYATTVFCTVNFGFVSPSFLSICGATMPSDTVATIAAIFYFFSVIGLCFFFLLNIYVSWYIYCYTDITNFTIFSQLLTCQFLTSQNKIIKYETVTNHN